MGLLGSCQGSLPFSVKLWHQRHAKVSFRGRTREQKLKSPTTAGAVLDPCLLFPGAGGSQASGQGAWMPHPHLVGSQRPPPLRGPGHEQTDRSSERRQA